MVVSLGGTSGEEMHGIMRLYWLLNEGRSAEYRNMPVNQGGARRADALEQEVVLVAQGRTKLVEMLRWSVLL